MTASFGGDGGILGEDSIGGWGEAAPEEESELLPNGGVFQQDGGHRLELNESQWLALLHRPEAEEAITASAEAICDTANGLVAMDSRAVERLGKGEPAYKFTVQNRAGTTRARGRIFPANMLGAVDNKHHETLQKALMSAPSDPIGQILFRPDDSAHEIVFGEDYEEEDYEEED